jgi:hypothetical protein
MVDEIYALLTAKADALVRRASADLASLLDPGFVYVNANGMTFDKATYIDVYCTSGKVVFSEQRISDLSVRQFEGFAVATLILEDRFSSVAERIVCGRYRSLCVFSGRQDIGSGLPARQCRPTEARTRQV